MKLYTINEEYINFLKIFSENVKYNKNESRPYVGIVLKINEDLVIVQNGENLLITRKNRTQDIKKIIK